MKRRFEVAWDASCLSTVLDSPRQIRNLLALVERRAVRLVLPELAVAEVVQGREGLPRAHQLADLLGLLHPNAVSITDPPGEIIRMELGAGVPGLETPSWDRSRVDRWCHSVQVATDREKLQEFEHWRQAMDKGGWLATDRAARDAFDERFPGKSSKTLSEQLHSPELGRWLLEVSLKDDQRAIERVLAAPERHLFSSTMAGLGGLAAWGAVLSGKTSQEHQMLLKHGPGDWVDARIAASAAYADVLVTSDGTLRLRLEHLRSLNRAKVSPISLGDAWGL